MTLYFAYGSNLWRKQMRQRCPEHKEIGSATLKGYCWIISARGYANIVVSEPDLVMGKVYELSPADEEKLDRYEGVARHAYRKELLPVEMCDGKISVCLVYIDPVVAVGRPWEEYAERLKKGLADAEIPAEYFAKYLKKFLQESLPDSPLQESRGYCS